MIETVKSIAAVLGCILSVASVTTLVVTHWQKSVKGAANKYGHTDEQDKDIKSIKAMLEDHVSKDEEFKDMMREFVKDYCRNAIKGMFYRYKDSCVLPLFEKKTLMKIEDLYSTKLHGNSYASFLISEMNSWAVDYAQAESGQAEQEDEEQPQKTA